MGTRMGLALGLGIGFVLGARAGREKYEQIKRAVGAVAHSPVFEGPVAEAAGRVSDFARDVGARATDRAADAVKERLFGARTDGPAAATGTSAHPIHIHVEDAGPRR